MSERDDVRDTLETLKADVKDAADELKQRGKAAGERAERAVRGDDMPLHEKIGSQISEKLDEAKAEVDRAKRDVRHAED
jgi:hypothetical protein